MRLQLTAAAAILCWAGLVSAARADAGGDGLSLDTLVYGDTDHVYVVSPQLTMRRQLDDEGGELRARGVVDLISAASVDVVSAATPGFSERRDEVDLSARKRVHGWLGGLGYRYSQEPDYVSHGAGVSLEHELGTRDATGAVSYTLTVDTVGRHGTPDDNWSAALTTHDAELSYTQVLGPFTLVRVAYTLVVQQGYMEKPYRYVPLFDAAGVAAADADGVALGADSFDDYRLAERPPEEVPYLRVRHAFAARGLRYLASIGGSLRLDYRFYLDSWGVLAHTGELGLRAPVGAWELELAGRGYWQSGAEFWSRLYVVEAGTMPRWRSLDRDLAASWAFTGTMRLGRQHDGWGWYLLAAANTTRYLDFLFLDRREALVVQAGLRWSL